jgi:site-specific DNA recombinase
MKAVTYSRYSTDGQSDESILDQQRVAAAYAARHGMTITQDFADAGISGAALGNRPGVLKMIAAAEAKRFDVLLLNDTTRLSRSQDLSPLVARLRHAGVRVIGVQDGFDSDSRTARMQAGMSGIMSEEFRAMISDRTRSARNMRASARRPVGGKAYGYTTAERTIVPEQAAIVSRIFSRYVEGASYRTIAHELNAKGVPSPGSYWAGRKVRRATGWMTNAVKGILENELYTGLVTWNKTVWSRDPASGRRVCRPRAASEWIQYRDEALRIVSDDVWTRARKRTRLSSNSDVRLKSGGKSKYALSGLMHCAQCGAHFILVSASKYGCSSRANGGASACPNSKLLRKERAEKIILAPIRDGLLAPKRVRMIAAEFQTEFNARSRAAARRAEEAPAEVRALDERIARLRGRLKAGDPDMTPDEIGAAIAVAEAKRAAAIPPAPLKANISTLLPKAAALYRAKIDRGLEGDPVAATAARTVLRGLVGGKIDLVTEPDGSLWAVYGLNLAALLEAAVAGQCGSGGRI